MLIWLPFLHFPPHLAQSTTTTSTRTQAVLVVPRFLHNSALRMADSPNHNSKATGSEASVHAEKHDDDPATLQKKTAQQAQKNHDTAGHKSTHNDVPTHSEDSVHADKHDHDPLPDHKKASNSQK